MADSASVDPEYRRYVAEIDLYEKEFRPWVDRSKKILKLYKDASNEKGQKKRFNVLWSNVQTLQPALYARTPQPVAERRFKDSDPVGRSASEVIERCLSYTIDCQNYDGVTKQAVSDRLLPGRGVAWHRYEADEADESGSYGERVIPDYVYWEDFGHNVARTWEEVTIVWRKVYMTRAKLVKRFGNIGKDIPLDHTPKGLKDEKIGEDLKKACIYELWDKDEQQIAFLSKSHPKLIEKDPDRLKITGMFPCQRPLFATITTDSLVPAPDYALYQTQAQELEDLTARIDLLQKALLVRGVYDSSAPALAHLLSGGYENKMIPVEGWAKFAESGGLEGAVDFLPIKEVAETLIALYEAREKSKQDLYEITGIADIIRGNSEPEETATAQQIKGRFAVLRISDAQMEVQRWVRDGCRIMGEIIAEHYDLETIKAISGVKLPTQAEKQAFEMQQQQAMQMAQKSGQQPPPVDEEQAELMQQPTWEEVHGLLKHQVLREFRIDIETDSTIRTDEDADREQRTEFLVAAGTYIDKAVIAMQTAPELGPLLGELLMFGVRSHRAARSLEPVFEDAVKKLGKREPAQGDPEMEKVKGELKLKQAEMEMKAQVEERIQAAQAAQERERMQIEDQRAERDAQREMAMKQQEMQDKKELEILKANLKAQTDLKVAQIQVGQQAAQSSMELQADQQNREADREVDQESREADREQSERIADKQIKSKERVETTKAKAKAKE